MDLIKFRVTMYKGIRDSRWVDVNDLTVLVGKNESGKTSLLRALHKLNPYAPDPNDDNPNSYGDNSDSYDINREYPRALWNERSDEEVACRAKFRLSAQENAYLAQIAGTKDIPDTVEVSRNYAGEFKVYFEDDIFTDRPSPVVINNIFDNAPDVQDEFSAEFKELAHKCLKEARYLAGEGQLDELAEAFQVHQNSLLTVLSPSDSVQQIEVEFLNQYAGYINRALEMLQQSPSIRSEVDEFITNRLPTFIYMDDYRAFSGTAQLNEIQNRRDNGQLTDEDRTFLMILELSGIDLGGLIQLGREGKDGTAVRKQDLTAGANTLTKILVDRLKPRSYVVDLDVDGEWFFTYIKDDFDQSPIELEERSKGFQWTFSFELMFTHESKGAFENCVILLDEPGLHLHPNAQQQLLKSLEDYAKENTLLYTSHLPFMIDLNHPERIRVLEETDDDGIIVTTNFTESSPDTKFVLQAALGMDISLNSYVTKNNLVVEGVEDYLVLSALSNRLQEDGKIELPEDLRITPALGASAAVYLAAFMIGQDLNVVALFDSDDEGRRAEEKLVKKWLTQYNPESQSDVIMLGEAVGVTHDFALEDLFTEDFFIEAVWEVYSKDLEAKGVTEIAPDPNAQDMLWKRVERFMKDNGIKINKGPIAKQLVKKIYSMENSSELPCETRNYAIALFQKISDALQ